MRAITTSLTLSLLLIAAPVAAQVTTTLPSRFGIIGGAHFGTPAKISFALGISRQFGREESRWRDSTWLQSFHARHLFVLAEPGISAGRISAGYGVVRGRRDAMVMRSGRLSVLRRWWGTDVGASYLGGEAELMGTSDLALGLRLGVFRRIAGPTATGRTLLTIDFPLGW